MFKASVDWAYETIPIGELVFWIKLNHIIALNPWYFIWQL